MAPAVAATYSELLRQLSEERFLAVLGHSPRQAKESYFARHHIRAPKSSSILVGPGHKTRARLLGLRAVFVRGDDDTLAEEIMRRFLLAHRQMLIVVLDAMNIAHDDGLTDSEDLRKLGTLDAQHKARLCDEVEKRGAASAQDAQLYLDFMALQTRNAA